MNIHYNVVQFFGEKDLKCSFKLWSSAIWRAQCITISGGSTGFERRAQSLLEELAKFGTPFGWFDAIKRGWNIIDESVWMETQYCCSAACLLMCRIAQILKNIQTRSRYWNAIFPSLIMVGLCFVIFGKSNVVMNFASSLLMNIWAAWWCHFYIPS